MKKLKPHVAKRPTLFKRINAPYRVVFIDDESLEEVASFTLTKNRMYMLFSTAFVVIVGITLTILLLTPLRYYIPGYGNSKSHNEVIQLKQTVDSLSDMMLAQQVYAANIQKVISGEYTGVKDTTMLDMDKVKKEAMNSILPDPSIIKQEAIKEVKKAKQNTTP